MTFARLKNWLAARRERRLRAKIWLAAMHLVSAHGISPERAVQQLAAGRRYLQTLDVTTMQFPAESADR